MILVLWLGRLLDRTSYYVRRAADAIYRPYYRRENRRAKRESELRIERFRIDELTGVTDARLVEHIGGPDDGEQRPLCENGRRPGGLYVVVNENDRVVAKQFVRITDSPIHRDR